MANTDLKNFIVYLQNLDENTPFTSNMDMIKVLERFPQKSADCFKVLVPSVVAWQKVWTKCVELGMDATSKTEAGQLVTDFIDKLATVPNCKICKDNKLLDEYRKSGICETCCALMRAVHIYGGVESDQQDLKTPSVK